MEINLLIQESSESDSDVAKPIKKNSYGSQMVDVREVSEVDKEKENHLEDDNYNIGIKKSIYH